MASLAHFRRLSGGFVWVLALLLVGLQATPVFAVESGGVGGRPAKPDPKSPRTESIFIFSVDPGQKAESAVKVYNNSGADKTVAVYAVDSQISSGGAFACAQLDKAQQGISKISLRCNRNYPLRPGSPG